MTEPSTAWQERCTHLLSECVDVGGIAGAEMWSVRKTALDLEAQKTIRPVERARVIIADGKFSGKDLSHFSFQFCYITRTDFTDASLRDANFDRSIVRSSRFVRADLRGAKFTKCSIDTSNIGWYSRIDHRSQLDFAGNVDNLGGFGAYFRNRVAEDQVIADAQETIESQWLRGWYSVIDYGRSVSRVLVLFGAIVLLFSIIYAGIYGCRSTLFDDGNWTLTDFFIMSTQRFINGPAFFGGHGLLLQTLFTLEAATGFGALALFAAVLLRKLIVLR